MKTIRLAAINDREAAYRWLPAAIARHNARFAVAPRHGLRGKKITVCQASDGTLTQRNGEQMLP